MVVMSWAVSALLLAVLCITATSFDDGDDNVGMYCSGSGGKHGCSVQMVAMACPFAAYWDTQQRGIDIVGDGRDAHSPFRRRELLDYATSGNLDTLADTAAGQPLPHAPRCKKVTFNSFFGWRSRARTEMNDGVICGIFKAVRDKFKATMDAGSYPNFKRSLRSGGGTSDTVEDFKMAVLGEVLRLVFSDAAEFNRRAEFDRFGPDGCLSQTAANNGLIEHGSFTTTFVEDTWQEHCEHISRADFWVMVGNVALEYSDPSGHLLDKLKYSYGRRDSESCTNAPHASYESSTRLYDDSYGRSLQEEAARELERNLQIGAKNTTKVPVDRIPLGEKTEFHDLARFFVEQLGLSISDVATLMGAHTIGQVHPENSGFGLRGAPASWTQNPSVFDNSYYIMLIEHNWALVDAPTPEAAAAAAAGGGGGKAAQPAMPIWTNSKWAFHPSAGPEGRQASSSSTRNNIMLSADIVLGYELKGCMLESAPVVHRSADNGGLDARPRRTRRRRRMSAAETKHNEMTMTPYEETDKPKKRPSRKKREIDAFFKQASTQAAAQKRREYLGKQRLKTEIEAHLRHPSDEQEQEQDEGIGGPGAMGDYFNLNLDLGQNEQPQKKKSKGDQELRAPPAKEDSVADESPAPSHSDVRVQPKAGDADVASAAGNDEGGDDIEGDDADGSVITSRGCGTKRDRNLLYLYSGDNAVFLEAFAKSYHKLVTVGYGGGLSATTSARPDTRFGSLVDLDSVYCRTGRHREWHMRNSHAARDPLQQLLYSIVRSPTFWLFALLVLFSFLNAFKWAVRALRRRRQRKKKMKSLGMHAGGGMLGMRSTSAADGESARTSGGAAAAGVGSALDITMGANVSRRGGGGKADESGSCSAPSMGV